MIFLCNSEGTIQAVSPSSINQGSVSLTELILLAPFPPQSVVQAMFKLPNGLIIRPQLLTQEEYDYNLSPLEQFNDDLEEFGLYAWSIKINRAITQFYGTLTVSFVITGEDAIITTTEANIPINKSGTALPIPVTEEDISTITGYLNAAKTARDNAVSAAGEAQAAVESLPISIKATENPSDFTIDLELVNKDGESVSASPIVTTLHLPKIRDGEGEGSIVIGDGEAYGENSLAQGTGAIAGATAYRISAVNTTDSAVDIQIDISEGGISDRTPSACAVFLEIIEGDTSRNIVKFSTPKYNWFKSENNLANSFPSLRAVVPYGAEINLDNSYIYISNNPYSGPVILGNNAFVSGKSTKAIFDNSTALGEGTHTSRDNQLAIGEYNADLHDALFIVGNGTEENPSNALEVLADGTIIGKNLVDEIDVSLNNADYKLTISLIGQDGEIVGTEKTIDLPLETMIVDVDYDSTNKDLILTLQNGNTIAVSLDDIIAGLPTNLIDGTADGAIQSTTSTLNGKGDGAKARGAVSVGTATSATELEAFAEGAENKATAKRAHASGNKTHARHNNSYTGGFSTLSSAANQMTIGQFNAPDEDALFIVGNGTDDNNRSNALAVRKDGTIVGNLGGKLYRHWINVYVMPFTIGDRDTSCAVFLEYLSSDANPITTYADVINRLPSQNRSNFSPPSYYYEYDSEDGRRVLYRVYMYSSSMNLEYYTSFGAPPTTASFLIDAQYISVSDTVTEV